MSIVSSLPLFFIEKAINGWQHLNEYSAYQLDRMQRKRFHKLFHPKEEDIFVVSHMKSGTTWTQMILFQLCHGKEMSIDQLDHIEDATPWYDVTVDKIPEAYPKPLIFKSHELYGEVGNRPGRYIYVMRNGMDVVLSLYHHLQNFFGMKTSYPDFFDQFCSPDRTRNWFEHVAHWLENPLGKNVLILSYEELHENLDTALDRIAAFCNIDLNEEDRVRVKENSSFANMKKHWNKFGIRDGEKRKKNAAFLRKGQTKEGVEMLSNTQKLKFRKRFDLILGKYPEVASYRPQIED